MKLKHTYLMREVAGQTVVIPAEGATDLNTMITLNETGKLLWQRLEQECTLEDLTRVLTENYPDVAEADAAEHAAAFVAKLKENDIVS